MGKGLGRLLSYTSGTPTFSQEELLAYIPENQLATLEGCRLLTPFLADDWFCEECSEHHKYLVWGSAYYQHCPESLSFPGRLTSDDERRRWHWQWPRFRQIMCEANLLSPASESGDYDAFLIGFNTTTLLAWVPANSFNGLLQTARRLREDYPQLGLTLLVRQGLLLKAAEQARLKELNMRIHYLEQAWKQNWVIASPELTGQISAPDYPVIIEKSKLKMTIHGKDFIFKPSFRRHFKTICILFAAQGSVVSEDGFFDQYHQAPKKSKTNSNFHSQMRVYVHEAEKYLRSLRSDIMLEDLVENVRGEGYRITQAFLPAQILD